MITGSGLPASSIGLQVVRSNVLYLLHFFFTLYDKKKLLWDLMLCIFIASFSLTFYDKKITLNGGDLL